MMSRIRPIIFYLYIFFVITFSISLKAQTHQKYRVFVSCPQPMKNLQEQMQCRYDTVYVYVLDNKDDTVVNESLKKPEKHIYKKGGKYYRIVVSCPARKIEEEKPLQCHFDTVEISKYQYYALINRILLPEGSVVVCDNIPKSSEQPTSRCYVMLPDGTRKEISEYMREQLNK